MKKLAAGTFALASLGLLTVQPAPAQAPAAPSIAQLNMDAVPRLDTDGVRKVQALLKQKGFEPGRFDGIAGPITRAAVRAFQERYGIKPGEIDNQTLFALGAVELAGSAGAEN